MSLEFTIKGEDHTLGHLIQQQLLTDPKVSFVGYTVPSFSERNLVIKIETSENDPREILQKNIEIIKDKLNIIKL